MKTAKDIYSQKLAKEIQASILEIVKKSIPEEKLFSLSLIELYGIIEVAVAVSMRDIAKSKNSTIGMYKLTSEEILQITESSKKMSDLVAAKLNPFIFISDEISSSKTQK